MNPTSHFLSCFVGEGQSQNAPRRYPISNERRNSVGDDGCLATSGPCVDQQGTTSMVHDGSLGGCQASQVGLKSGRSSIGFGQIHGWSLSTPRQDAANRPQPCDSCDHRNTLKHMDLENTRQCVEDLVVQRLATTRYWVIFRPAPPSSGLAFDPFWVG